MINELQLTPASDWKQQTWITKLPSGKVIEVKKPEVFEMIADDGTIPDTAFEMFMKGDGKQQSEMSAKDMREQMQMLLLLSKRLIPHVIVNLTVVTEGDADYDNGEIHVTDLDQQDRIFLVMWAMEGGEPELALARFLEQSKRASVPVASNMPDVLPASVTENGH